MASRPFYTDDASLTPSIRRLFGKVTFGTTGAPTLDTAKSKGIASITRTSAGLFVITLNDRYVRFLNLKGIFLVAAASFPAAPLFQVTAETVATTKTITVQFSDADTPAATDPADTEVFYFEISLCDSSAT